MADTNGQVITGNIAIVKANGKIIAKMKSVRYVENLRRVDVRGIGSTFASEVPVVEASGQLTCDFMETLFSDGGVPGALNRNFSVVRSQALIGKESYEDQIVLDTTGVQIEIYKKVSHIIDPITKVIKPGVIPYAIVPQAFIESDSFELSESNIGNRAQSFKCTDPIIFP